MYCFFSVSWKWDVLSEDDFCDVFLCVVYSWNPLPLCKNSFLGAVMLCLCCSSKYIVIIQYKERLKVG